MLNFLLTCLAKRAGMQAKQIFHLYVIDSTEI
jgi:hypothetical protein